MSNMSYCLFNNTRIDFNDCLNKLYEMNTLRELSDPEAKNAQQLRYLCFLYMEEFDRVKENTEQEDREDRE